MVVKGEEEEGGKHQLNQSLRWSHGKEARK